MFNGSNCDRKSQLFEILTEPLNPRCLCYGFEKKNLQRIINNARHLNVHMSPKYPTLNQ